jgi:hypothetical protein
MQAPLILRERIEQRKCVAFVGAGFSMACGMPGWWRLIQALISTAHASAVDPAQKALIENARRALDSGSLPLAASIVRQALTASELDLAVRRQFDLAVFRNCPPGAKLRMTQRLKNLVTAPWAGIITTNYDELVEHALSKWSEFENHRSTGLDYRLGSILAGGQGEQFFVKLHGTIGGSQIVLSTEEYDRMYLGSPQVSSFLVAVMLCYHLVFIGCSLEDDLVRLRRKLSVDFDGVIPMAYAILPRTKENAMRATWLRESVQVETLFYEDGAHESLDRFLRSTAQMMSSSKAKRFGVTKTAAQILKQPPQRRVKEIGSVNLELLRWIYDSPRHTITRSGLLQAGLSTSGAPPALRARTTEEIMYRVFFLVSVKMLEEVISSRTVKYFVPEKLWGSLA